MSAKTLYLIDGHAQFFRAYHALPSGMTSPVTHEPTNMTYGFVAMLLKLLREHRPDYLAVVIDVSGDRESFRSELYPEYKANRPPAPEDLGPQIERCLELLGTMGIPVLGEAGVEADDVIATLVRRMRREHPDLRMRIISRDKDLTQLSDDAVELFDVHKDEVVTPAGIFKTEGIEARHVVDVLALMGDNVDNVPGVAGIGPKTAGKLILQYDTLDNLLAHIEEIKGKRRENIEAARDQLPLSRELVRLRDDVEVEFDLEAAVSEPSRLPADELLARFRELGFNQHRDTLSDLVGRAPGPTGASASARDPDADPPAADPRPPKDAILSGGLFAGSEAAVALRPPPTETYEAIRDVAALSALVETVAAAGVCALDVETDGLFAMRAGLCGISLATEAGSAAYIPIRSPEPDSHLDQETVLRTLRPVLEDASVTKVGHNLKFDLNILRRHGVTVQGPLFDTMIASYVIDATRSSHKLDVLALSLLGRTCIPLDELIGRRGSAQLGFDEVPLAQAVPYAAEDADIVLRLRDIFTPVLAEMGLTTLFETVEIPLVRALAELEYNGIIVDPAELDRQRETLATRIDELRRKIAGSTPSPFNPDSPKQLAAVLFNAPEDEETPGLGLKVVKRGKTGPSTDQEVLEKLAGDPDIDSPVPGLLIEYRQLTKLVNTYLVALKEAINPETGRVHASFNQTVAATGRLSSSDPNLQNIPVRTDVGREIRRAFVAPPGHQLITADYSQIELRLLAHLAEDPALIEAFREGADIHTAVAAEVYGVSPDAVTGPQRNTAKMVNFGIIYGITAFGLARRLGGEVSRAEAAQIIEDYKKRFTRIDSFLAECVATAQTKGYVETILKRRRRIPQVAARNPAQRSLGERMAINTVVQGSAADLIKVAMIDLYEALPTRFGDAAPKLLLQIHDELVLEAADAVAEETQAFVVGRMENAMELAVPLEVGTARSTVWIDAK
ncbi:MAG: DNA polymerase I [Phycisphaerales bacterium]|nr:DNA polymerase I [Phycisphaerales bacterium]